MKKTTIALVAGLACSAALAGPTGPATEKDKSLRGVAAPGQGAIDGVPAFVENFDSYAAGGGLSGMGGWEPWYGTGLDGEIVDNPPGNSAPNSFQYSPLTDQVNTINFTNQTKYVVSAYSYVHSGTAGDGYFIVNNEYDGALLCAEWAAQVRFNGLNDIVSNDAAGFVTVAGPTTLPLQRDRWMRYTAIVDLTTDVYWDYYGSDLLSDEYLGAPLGWAVNNALAGVGCDPAETLAIANIDLFSNTLDMQQMDDVVVACYADMTAVTGAGGVGTLDIFDFLAFQDGFVANDVVADCDGNQSLDIFDFLCFQDAFVAGCG